MDWTWHVGDLVMAAIGLLLVPLFRVLVQMRDDIRDIKPKVVAMERDVTRHHEWLIAMRAKLGFTNGQQEPR